MKNSLNTHSMWALLKVCPTHLYFGKMKRLMALNVFIYVSTICKKQDMPYLIDTKKVEITPYSKFLDFISCFELFSPWSDKAIYHVIHTKIRHFWHQRWAHLQLPNHFDYKHEYIHMFLVKVMFSLHFLYFLHPHS